MGWVAERFRDPGVAPKHLNGHAYSRLHITHIATADTQSNKRREATGEIASPGDATADLQERARRAKLIKLYTNKMHIERSSVSYRPWLLCRILTRYLGTVLLADNGPSSSSPETCVITGYHVRKPGALIGSTSASSSPFSAITRQPLSKDSFAL